MQIWNTETWQCQHSIRVPARIIPMDENQFEPAVDNAKRSGTLNGIQVLSAKQTTLAVAYDDILGLLELPNSQLTSVDFVPQFTTSFHPIIKCRDIHHLQSNNQALLVFRCHLNNDCVSNVTF